MTYLVATLVVLGALLAFAHVGVRAAAQVAREDDASEPATEPAANLNVPTVDRNGKYERLTYKGNVWFRDGYYWYREDGEKVGDQWGIDCEPLLEEAILTLKKNEQAAKFRS